MRTESVHFARRSLQAALLVGLMSSLADAQTLPAPWTSTDIGAPTLSGSVVYGSGVFTIDAGGNGLGGGTWQGPTDQIHFLSQTVTGDVDIVARVDDLISRGIWTEAGVMIRSSLAADSAHATAEVTASRGVQFAQRLDDGGATAYSAGPVLTAPVWLRATRVGTRVTAYSSTDGTTWTTLGSATISLGSTAYVGLSVSSHNPNYRTTAGISNVRVTQTGLTGLPSTQRAIDIGSPSPAGSTMCANGAYTIRSTGTDIWDSADRFHFVYQPVTGNAEVVARVGSIALAHAWAKGGVMVRESLTAASKHASMLLSAGSGYAFQRREETGLDSVNTSGGSGTAPGWVKLVRNGDLFEAFRSADGTSWTRVGSDTIAMGLTVYVGLALSSPNVSTATTAIVDNFRITSSSTGNQPPAVSLTAPANGTRVNAPATVTLTASASDPENRMASVDFYVGSTLLVRDTTAPYSASWSAITAGTYPLTAVAHDADGGSTTSGAVSVTVNSLNGAPSVTLTSPIAGSTFTAPATINLGATASDPENQLSRVDFYNGTTLLGSDTTAPYTYSWTNVPAGSYSVTARAFDGSNLSTTSAPLTIAVNGPQGLPAGQAAADIGSPVLAGQTSYSSGTYTVRSGGYDIWGAADQFHFVYQQVTGNVEIIARVASVGNSAPWAKAGVMVRETLSGASRHMMMGTSAGNGGWFGRRVQTSGSTTSIRYSGGAPPVWVRLVRTGDLLQAYRSSDGANWALINSETLVMTPTVYVGLAASSQDTTATTTALFDNVRINGSSANQPPTVSLTTNGVSFTAPASITMTANASDPENQLARVEFYRGTTLLGSDTSAPYTYSWTNVAAGSYTLTAVAVDAAGNRTTSSAANVTVTTTTSTPPRLLVFTASSDHATNVTSYRFDVFTSTANPSTATPVATANLGKPTPASNGEITSDQSTLFNNLAAGNYIATVTAIGPGGSTRSATVSFTR